jgi:hypothetical protein
MRLARIWLPGKLSAFEAAHRKSPYNGLREPVLLAHVNLAVLHHEFHIFERANILQRIGAHGDSVRILSRLDRAKFI